MKQHANGTEQPCRLTVSLQLDVSAEQLGLSDGHQCTVADETRPDRKRGRTGKRDGCRFTLSFHNTAEGACDCTILSERSQKEWLAPTQYDYFRYTDALVFRLLAQINEKEKISLTGHVKDVKIITPLEDCLLHPERGSEALKKKARILYPERQELIVTDAADRGGLLLVTLQRSDGFTAANFRAGQSLALTWQEKGRQTTADCLLCSSPAITKEGVYRIALPGGDGGFARKNALAPGASVTASAPQGDFYHVALRDCHTVIGITDRFGAAAFSAMAAAIRDGLEKFKLTVLYLESDRGDFPFGDEFSAVAAECGSVRLIRFPDEETDRLTAERLRPYLPHEAYSVFVCGAKDLCDKAGELLDSLRLPEKNVRIRQLDFVPDPGNALPPEPTED